MSYLEPIKLDDAELYAVSGGCGNHSGGGSSRADPRGRSISASNRADIVILVYGNNDPVTVDLSQSANVGSSGRSA